MTESRILFLSCQGIGNAVLCFPLLEHFRNRGVICDCVVSNGGTSKLIREFGLVQEVLEWNESENAARNFARLWPLIRRRTYKAVYALAPAGRRENILLRITKAEKKQGWKTCHFFRQFSLLDPEAPLWNENQHDLESNRLLCGLTREEVKEAIERLRTRMTREISFPSNGPLAVAIQPFTKEAEKSWDESEYRNFLKRMEEKTPMEFYFLGGEQDKKRLQGITENLKSKAVLLAGRPWKDVISVLKKADLFIGVDSCMAHLAGLLNIPSLVLYGFTNPGRTGALGEKTVIVGGSECGESGFFTKKTKKQRMFPLRIETVLEISYPWIHSLRNGHAHTPSGHEARQLPFGAQFFKIETAGQNKQKT